MQLFWSCLSFEEECAPFNFRPKVICRFQASLTYTLLKKKCIIKKSYRICIRGHPSLSSFSLWENHQEFLIGVIFSPTSPHILFDLEKKLFSTGSMGRPSQRRLRLSELKKDIKVLDFWMASFNRWWIMEFYEHTTEEFDLYKLKTEKGHFSSALSFYATPYSCATPYTMS